MPAWAGQLPQRVGYPAGGSLTADEYKVLVLLPVPMMVIIWLSHYYCTNKSQLPFVWDAYYPEALKDYKRAIEGKRKGGSKKEKAKRVPRPDEDVAIAYATSSISFVL
jgi:hypothetical protein